MTVLTKADRWFTLQQSTSSDAGWHGDCSNGFVARVDPKSGAVKAWTLPRSGTRLPYATTVNDVDRLSFVATGCPPDRRVAFEPRTGRITARAEHRCAVDNPLQNNVLDETMRGIRFGRDRNMV